MRRVIASAVTALVLAAGGVWVTALPASAHQGSVEQGCDELHVHLENYQSAPNGNQVNHIIVTVNDGEVPLSEDFTGTRDYTVPLPPIDGGWDWTVTVYAWDDPEGVKGYSFIEVGHLNACHAPAHPSGSAVVVCGETAGVVVTVRNPGDEPIEIGIDVYDTGTGDLAAQQAATAPPGDSLYELDGFAEDSVLAVVLTSSTAPPVLIADELVVDCAPDPDARAALAVTPATCTTDGSVAWTTLTAATPGELDQTPGVHSATATAATGHVFDDGSATSSIGYTVPAKTPAQSTDPSAPCYRAVLAATGPTDVTQPLVAGAGFVAVGAVLTTLGARRRRSER